MMTTSPLFPFAALVGLDEMQLALRLAAIDHRLSVLLRGDKGAGKSTAARGLGALLGDASPFVNLPIGATEDRLLGGLDLARALDGKPSLKPGLLSAAHGGVLYVDEINLLPDHLADTMLDVVASGVLVVEREGFSRSQPADFVLIGSMNPEEGALRPQLLDRFALVVDVDAPMAPADRRLVVQRRLMFERDPSAFVDAWRASEAALAAGVHQAREALEDVNVDEALLDAISEQVCAHGVRSLRADLAIVRASRALAALDGATTVTIEHVTRVLPLALRHRAGRRLPNELATPPPPPSPEQSSTNSNREKDSLIDSSAAAETEAVPDRVFAPRAVQMPRIVATVRPSEATARASGSSAASGVAVDTRGPAIRSRASAEPRELDVRATLAHAIAETGVARPRIEDLHEIVRAPIGGRRYLFVIDASGSQAVQQRMRLVKGAVDALLDQSVRRRDEIAIVSFRGAQAEIALTPTSDLESARQALLYLPTGGRTPLAHALELAASLVTDDTVLVLLTDGRANVATATDDPWIDALTAAARVSCPALVIDSEAGAHPIGRAVEIAARMHAAHVRLDALDQHALIEILRRAPDVRRMS